MSELNKLWYSQASISAWLNCPLKFKYRYIDGLYWPLTVSEEVTARVELGRKFHLLAQNYYALGQSHVPPGEDGQVKEWLVRLQEFLPRTPERVFLPEYELRVSRQGMRLLAKYDLLVRGAGTTTIYDWKTDQKAPQSSIAASPQTRLYLYLLSHVPDFAQKPRDVQMVYWNPRYPRQPLTVSYSPQQQQKDEQWLSKIVQDIQQTASYPATSNQANCRFCEYRPVCHGQMQQGEQEVEIEAVDWDEIEEIALQGVNLT